MSPGAECTSDATCRGAREASGVFQNLFHHVLSNFTAGNSENTALSFKFYKTSEFLKDKLATAFAKRKEKRDTLSLEKLYTLYFRTLV